MTKQKIYTIATIIWVVWVIGTIGFMMLPASEDECARISLELTEPYGSINSAEVQNELHKLKRWDLFMTSCNTPTLRAYRVQEKIHALVLEAEQIHDN